VVRTYLCLRLGQVTAGAPAIIAFADQIVVSQTAISAVRPKYGALPGPKFGALDLCDEATRDRLGSIVGPKLLNGHHSVIGMFRWAAKSGLPAM
jgi:hypothetical protein